MRFSRSMDEGQRGLTRARTRLADLLSPDSPDDSEASGDQRGPTLDDDQTDLFEFESAVEGVDVVEVEEEDESESIVVLGGESSQDEPDVVMRVERIIEEWIDFLTPSPTVDEEVEVDLPLLYRAHRAVLAREDISTSERPASRYCGEDILEYPDLDQIEGRHRAHIYPAHSSPERFVRFWRDRLAPRQTSRVVDISPEEVEALKRWQREEDGTEGSRP